MKFSYLFVHNKAYRQVEKQIRGKNTLCGFLHDLDKVFYFFLDDNKIHRKVARHHSRNKLDDETCLRRIIDLESGRLTKNYDYSAKQMLGRIYHAKEDKKDPQYIKMMKMVKDLEKQGRINNQ